MAEFQTASESACASQLDPIGARTDLDGVTVELVEMVKALDGINRWRFGSTPELLVEWNAAKHVPATRATTARERSDGGVTAREQSDRSSLAGGTAPPGAIAPAA